LYKVTNMSTVPAARCRPVTLIVAMVEMTLMIACCLVNLWLA